MIGHLNREKFCLQFVTRFFLFLGPKMHEALSHLLLHFSNPVQSLMNTYFLLLSVIVYLVPMQLG